MYELIEPLIENKEALEEIKSINSNINFHLAVAGEASGETWLEVSPDLDGSGIYGGDIIKFQNCSDCQGR